MFVSTKVLKKNRIFLILYILILIIILKCLSNYGVSRAIVTTTDSGNTKLGSCPIPIYKDFSQKLKDDVSLTSIICPIIPKLVSIINGTVKILNKGRCVYECISWNTDFSYKVWQSRELLDNEVVPCQYFIVRCDKNGTSTVDSQLIMAAVRHKDVVERSRIILNGSAKPRDVLVLGIDSMSFLAYKHYLPSIFNVLHGELKGVSFTKFNTLGDGTTVNLQGLLTGTRDTETHEARRRIFGARAVDDFQWIWRRYKDHGYLTQYYEEMTDYGTFQYRLLGFEEQPTDVYLRTFLMFAERTKISREFCLGGQPQHLEILRFYNDVLKVHNDVPTFSFIYFSLASHDDNKYAHYLDADIARFLVDTRKKRPETLIVLYADHGHRFNSRLSMQGKYEERLPFLGISLPDDMQHLSSVLRSNSDVLVSGLDVHATLEDLLGVYEPQNRGRHLSLLRPLPRDRTCLDIELPTHWCACVAWTEISDPNNDPRLVNVARAAVRQITEFTATERHLCAELQLDRIISLHQMNANEQVLRFKQSADIDGFVPDLSDKTVQSDIWFRIVLRSKPADAIFEVSVSLRASRLNNLPNVHVDKILPNDVSRINRYAPWIKCLRRQSGTASVVSDIRKFCICKDAL